MVKKISKDKLARAWKSSVNLRVAVGAIVAVGIFLLGVYSGNGDINFNTNSGQNKNLPGQLNYSSVNQVYQDLKNQFDGKLTTGQLMDGLKSGLTQATGDPFTEYFNASQAKQLNNELNDTFGGIGAQLKQNSNNSISIVEPLPNTPAQKAGLKTGDIIEKVNGKSVSGQSIDTVVSEIRGPIGSQVTLQVLRGLQTMNFTITRANITAPSVEYKVLPGNIGYIDISQFSNDTGSLAQKAANEFKKDKVKGVILDLRGNPGGYVTAAVDVSSLWLPQGQTIMVEKTGGKVVHTYASTGNDILHGVPTVVLIDGGSASASEITTGALHDNGDAYVIGTKSFGKGSVQTIDNLSGGAELKVTIAHWFRPNGQSINHIGITPDKNVTLSDAQAKAGNDTQLKAAENYLQSK